MTASPTDDLASAERRIQELTRELSQARGDLAEAREQQATTAAILAAIPNSATDPSGVFAEIAASAARLCDAYDATMSQVDAGFLRTVAHHGPIPQSSTLPLIRGFITGRSVLERQTIHIADVQALTDEYPDGSASARQLGHRTIVAVPLIHDGEAIGVIAVRRTEARPFTDRQIDLLKSFADQAVIAIENTRLFEEVQASKRELHESLEYQTATSDVLGAIARTPTQLQPVLTEICKTASRLCETYDSGVFFRDGDWLRMGLNQGPIGASLERLALTRGYVVGRAILDRDVVHVHDLRAAADEYPEGYQMSLKLGHRSIVAVPLVLNGESIGALGLSRLEVKPFNEKQIKLVRTFADQAVVAIQNARLFEAEQTRTKEVEAKSAELHESLEYQTAMSDVLNVISRSPTDVQPVFDSIAQSAMRLCEGEFAFVLRFDGELLQFAASYGLTPQGLTALRNSLPRSAGNDTANGRAILQRAVVQIPDVQADAAYGALGVAEEATYRSLVAVPLLHDGDPIGGITVGRAHVGSFSDSQITLLKSFADQAVIAIENTRLFEAEQTRNRELRDSLDRQTATSEVLGVISRSPNEVQPVLDTIVATAQRLCQA